MKAKPAYYKDTIHSMKRRAPWQNYYAPGQYMVTISKQKGCPDFGALELSTADDSFISLSSAGLIIKGEIDKTPSFSPELKIHDYVIMPDHLHILLEAVKPLKRHLGEIIQALKSASTSRIRACLGNPSLKIFEDGFHDRIIKDSNHFDIVQRYIRENPRRLAVRRLYPGYFRRVNTFRIGERCYQAYGNMQLLECPFREQVVVHRADSEDARAHNRDLWLYTAANGGVLVSPFISPAEKSVREEADDLGGRFILIVNEPMGERYKPSGRDFELCEAGRMLIVSAGISGEISREICLRMNGMAEVLAAVC